MSEKFFEKYFPPKKTAKLRARILSFQQDDGETFYEAWERFKDLMRKVPHHGLELWRQCETFYNGLDVSGRQWLDSYAGGDFGAKRPREAFELLEKAARKSYSQQAPRAKAPKQGVHQVDSYTALTAHGSQPAPEKRSNLEDMVARLLSNSESQSQLAQKQNQYMEDRFHKHETELRNQKALMQAIENQVGQIAKLLSERQQGGLRSNTEPNPNANVKAITLRSGKSTTALPPPASPSSSLPPVIEEVATEIPAEVHFRPGPASTAQAKEPFKDYTPPVPYPSRLKKQKFEEHYGKFLELFKQLHINLPFVEALAQMPKYAKFLKDILTNKKKLEELSHVILSEECSAILQNKLPQKMNDPRSFTIPCLIGSLSVSNALADLGASINLMPYAVFEKLGVEELKPTRMSIQLADWSVKYPRGIVENLLVEIDRFVFPVDFVILDMDEDKNVPLILGRPFLATARALIDVCSGKLTLRVYDEEVTFDIGRSMRHPQSQDDSLYFIDVVDSCMSDSSQDGCVVEVFDTQLLGREDVDPVSEGRFDEEMVALLSHDPSPQDEVFEVMDRKAEPKALPSVEDPPSVELKELPGHLEYAFLDGESWLPVIISSALTSGEKVKLFEVMKMHKKAIAWKIMDIKGINPSFCTHKISMEEDFKHVVQHQRRLNPNMQDVVKKEVIKLLDAGLIYPISDSPWVSPVQVIPKKGGMTVITNERNKLIPTRTVTGWRVCIDYRKLNDATRKDHFPLPFIDQMLERLSGKTRMPFGLCNAPATFQRCMVAIFYDMIEDSMEVFMDEFSVFGSSFDHWLENLRKMLARCEEANLVLNWEKCHFMVRTTVRLVARPCAFSDARPCGPALFGTAYAMNKLERRTTVLRTHDRADSLCRLCTACAGSLNFIEQMDHPFLHFDPNDERDASCIPMLYSLWGRRRQIEPMKCLSWDLVVNLNQQTRLHPLITEPWSRLFYINRPQYRELLMEFFASYSFSFPSQNVYRKRFGLTFRLGGRWRRFSVAQFATRMGLYTEGELDSEIFDELHDFEDKIEKAMFWAEVAEGVYDPRRAKATKLRDPLHRFIHRILVSTIMQRGDSLGNVPTRDLFYLYCLIRGIHCNIAHCLAYFLTTSSGKLASSHICGGAYITQLADSFGLLTEENIATFTHVCDTSPVDMRTLRYMQIVEQTPSAAAFHQFYVSEPPRFDYGYSSGGAQKCSRGGHDGEASGSGSHDDEED
ncbi:hypothetical protein E3N88_15617 [Mikania micrantha]|uniref:Reverse transcriptase domain-containing protein n=1 Tax=Mikania micrantha TaxID=192012 RepID=A0A5N6NX95_9ASTR|nr:hypothetical protein E3N88_15617 [Mikania micrantha]